MDCFSSDSDRYAVKSITWEIRKNSTWQYSSPNFDLNKCECSLTVNLTRVNSYQYNINSLNLTFTKGYTDYNDANFFVILHFPNAKHLLKLLSAQTTSKINHQNENLLLCSANNATTITEHELENTNCSITVEIYWKLDNYNISSFIDDMKSMLKTGIHSDFEIKACEKIFKVHKAVIATRSKVLKSMVENNMLEKKIGQLELQADPIVVEPLLDYLYTNECKVTAAPTELFKLAHFLQLEELQMYCKNYLLDNTHLKNIISILELTSYKNYNLKDLHDKAMKFVNTNENSLVADLEFEQFLYDNIKLETITYILRISYKHKLDNCLDKAMEFIRTNYKAVLDDTEFQNYLKEQPTLSLKILHYCLEYFNTDSNKKD